MGRGVEARGRGAREDLGFRRTRLRPVQDWLRNLRSSRASSRLWHSAALCVVCGAQRFQETDAEQVKRHHSHCLSGIFFLKFFITVKLAMFSFVKMLTHHDFK